MAGNMPSFSQQLCSLGPPTIGRCCPFPPRGASSPQSRQEETSSSDETRNRRSSGKNDGD